MPKETERGDPLASTGNVCYAEKNEKPFWFSSLGQMLQFDNIKFCRTCLVTSGVSKTRRERLKSALYLRLKTRSFYTCKSGAFRVF